MSTLLQKYSFPLVLMKIACDSTNIETRKAGVQAVILIVRHYVTQFYQEAIFAYKQQG